MTARVVVCSMNFSVGHTTPMAGSSNSAKRRWPIRPLMGLCASDRLAGAAPRTVGKERQRAGARSGHTD